jgi:serine/threonine-protein kinase RIO1
MAGKSRLSFGVILFFYLAVGVFAPAAGAQQEGKKASTTVTGCLQKGNEADVFAIGGEDGKNYELVSRNIKLSAHVGHKVHLNRRGERRARKGGRRRLGRQNLCNQP